MLIFSSVGSGAHSGAQLPGGVRGAASSLSCCDSGRHSVPDFPMPERSLIPLQIDALDGAVRERNLISAKDHLVAKGAVRLLQIGKDGTPTLVLLLDLSHGSQERTVAVIDGTDLNDLPEFECE